jgi:hypothetical protein
MGEGVGETRSASRDDHHVVEQGEPQQTINKGVSRIGIGSDRERERSHADEHTATVVLALAFISSLPARRKFWTVKRAKAFRRRQVVEPDIERADPSQRCYGLKAFGVPLPHKISVSYRPRTGAPSRHLTSRRAADRHPPAGTRTTRPNDGDSGDAADAERHHGVDFAIGSSRVRGGCRRKRRAGDCCSACAGNWVRND